MQIKLTELIKEIENDDEIKCILLHGGKYYTSGLDIGVFKLFATDPEAANEYARKTCCDVMPNLVVAMASVKKPLIVVVRGGCYGIGFTSIGHATMVYCTPEAVFQTSFMMSSQGPEGNSTMQFPKIFGDKVANEILLTDRMIFAKEAVRLGFANGLLADVDLDDDWVDPDLVPAIPKLLSYDLGTILHCQKQLVLSKDLKKIEEVTKREGRQLYEKMMGPEFLPLMMEYGQKLRAKAKAKVAKKMAKM